MKVPWLPLYLVLLAAASLSPLEVPHWFRYQPARPYPVDLALNVLVYIPLGMALRDRAPGKAVLAGFLLSATFESFQLFLFRTPSLWDVAMNVAGTAGGTLWPAAGCLHGLRMALARRRRILLAGGTTLVLGSITASLMTLAPVDFSNWEDFPLVLGDEATVDRPWAGELLALRIYDRVIPPPDSTAEKVDPPPWSSAGPVLWFAAGRPGELHLDGPSGPRLLEIDPPIEPRFGPGAGGRRILPEEAAAHVRECLRATSCLSVFVRVIPAAVQPGGQGRIVSMSLDFERRNFTLGQKGTSLHWRVRTPCTGPNGDRPQVITPDGTVSSGLCSILATFDGQRSRVHSGLDPGSCRGEVLIPTHRTWMQLPVLSTEIAFTLALASALAALTFSAFRPGPRWPVLAGGVLMFLLLRLLGAWDHFAAYDLRAAVLGASSTLACLPLRSPVVPNPPSPGAGDFVGRSVTARRS